MAISSLEIYKILPGTNCGDCGHPTCLSFVNDLIFQKKPPEACPHLRQADIQKIKDLVRSGSSQKLESYGEVMFHPLETALKRVQSLNFSYLSAVMGGGTIYQHENNSLVVPYLNSLLTITKNEARDEAGHLLPPGFQTALYNYLATVQKIHPQNTWVSFKELPGAVFLSSYFVNNVEGMVSGQFSTRSDLLLKSAVSLGGQVIENENISPADVKLSFILIPKVNIRLLFWDSVPEEGLPAVATFLFDAGIYQLDLESLTYLIEELVKRLIAAL